VPTQGPRQECDDVNRSVVLVVLPAAERPSPSSLDRVGHEYRLKDELDGALSGAAAGAGGRTMLVLEDPGGKPPRPVARRSHGAGKLLAARR